MKYAVIDEAAAPNYQWMEWDLQTERWAPAVAIKMKILFSLQPHQLQENPALLIQELKINAFSNYCSSFSVL